MDAAVIKEIEALRKMTVAGLRQSCDEEFGEESRSNGPPTAECSCEGCTPISRQN